MGNRNKATIDGNDSKNDGASVVADTPSVKKKLHTPSAFTLIEPENKRKQLSEGQRVMNRLKLNKALRNSRKL